jgi:hypothetical protein
MKLIICISGAALLSGCVATDLSGLASPITALTAAASNTVALEQELADLFVKESAQLYFLSSGKETCLDNDTEGLKIKPYTKVMAYKKQEEAYLKLRLADLYSLAAYGDSLASIQKEREQRSKEIGVALGLIAAGTQIAGYNPEFAAEAKLVKDAATAVAALANTIVGYEYDQKIIDEAKRMRTKVDGMLARLEDRFHIVGDRAQLYINAWRACTREKYVYIRDKMATPAKPVSIVELDTNYGTFRAQYREYLNRIPHIEKSAFEKIRQANNAMLEAPTPEEFAKEAQRLADLVGQLISTYKTVKDSARGLFGV